MTVWEMFAEYDRLCGVMNDSELEVWLNEAFTKFRLENPEDFIGQSAVLNELGGFYRSRGVFNKGEQAFLMAKELLDSINNTESLDYATTLNNLAGLYRLTGEYKKALEMFEASQELYEKSEKPAPPELYASCLNNKGLVYQDMGRYEEAKEHFEKALSLINDMPNNGYVIATTLSNIAFACGGLGDKKKAALCIDKAADIFREEAGEDSSIYLNCLKARERLLNS